MVLHIFQHSERRDAQPGRKGPRALKRIELPDLFHDWLLPPPRVRPGPPQVRAIPVGRHRPRGAALPKAQGHRSRLADQHAAPAGPRPSKGLAAAPGREEGHHHHGRPSSLPRRPRPVVGVDVDVDGAAAVPALPTAVARKRNDPLLGRQALVGRKGRHRLEVQHALQQRRVADQLVPEEADALGEQDRAHVPAARQDLLQELGGVEHLVLRGTRGGLVGLFQSRGPGTVHSWSWSWCMAVGFSF
ncbi:hypothetical protein PG996_015957 [Apiospora saccharicola]|uniref:Uncharacterized protein n=1 Tax=Apiospora saccharicola TaxID=335842 RepID=A0ABR1TMK3_9PEZI